MPALRVPVREVLLSVAFLGGWAALSLGVASLLGPRVWWFAIALLLLSLGGWKLLFVLVSEGLYKLTGTPKKAPRRG